MFIRNWTRTPCHVMIDELSKYRVFSTFDLSSGYYQLKIAESDYKNTGFEVNDKLYEFTRIPFGVKMELQPSNESCRNSLNRKTYEQCSL